MNIDSIREMGSQVTYSQNLKAGKSVENTERNIEIGTNSPANVETASNTSTDFTGDEKDLGARVEDKVINEEMLENSIEQANKTLKPVNKTIERTIHEETHAVMYTMKNSETGEVISEFPPKKIQDMLAKMWEFAGLFLDEKI